ncbi:MAG TPA: aminotransferase class V-fold PLP-dependent enzyme [Symbiobacteriaceae bacterium]|nr:aminotransferase class V-fold PLP-dependent enzyme [Symbiobacteriaceae bacterium]
MPQQLIYLDNAATSHPKPETVYQAVNEALRAGGNPGRGGHRLALAAGRRVLAAREALASLLNAPDASRVLFTSSCTDSLNMALKGLLQPGDHVVTTALEHNALRRPLGALERQGISVTRVLGGSDGRIDPDAIRTALRPTTKLIALAHASNVSGAIQPVAEIGAVARQAGVLFLVDAAQSAGALPIDMRQMGIHLLAAPGHKGLLGPQGTGILCVDPVVALKPIREGGTGSRSSEEVQPDAFPEGFESGTLNLSGIAGLAAGVAYLQRQGVDRIRQHELDLTGQLVEGLRGISGVTVYGPTNPAHRAAVVAFGIEGIDPGEVEELLDDRFGVIGRAGLHCNPGCHAQLGTLAGGGAMRLSPGHCTTNADIAQAVRAVATLAALRRD